MKPIKRCALYTRKSAEEGLDQAFNSLDAQREACEAFVKSQKSEGWRALPALYDDGGWSGGSMERPALRRLLADIAAGKIDVVVVYKIDRLTRSLADFARMVELFDRHEISFVSVTQAFNTTSSMGRLTLNVLLSFAQFEREVTGERIRDKIAASKQKGMWMGGNVPLGYDLPQNGLRALVVNDAEAAIVRDIFQAYLELGSVHALQRRLEAEGICSKQRTTRDGKVLGGHAEGRLAIANTVDHVVPISEGGPAFPGHDGLASYCAPCHSAKTARGAEAGAIRSTKPRRGCNPDGSPLDPSHPWHAGKSLRADRRGPAWDKKTQLVRRGSK